MQQGDLKFFIMTHTEAKNHSPWKNEDPSRNT